MPLLIQVMRSLATDGLLFYLPAGLNAGLSPGQLLLRGLELAQGKHGCLGHVDAVGTAQRLGQISLTPAASSTARMLPPAMMPVPGAAGLSSTLAAPYLTFIS